MVPAGSLRRHPRRGSQDNGPCVPVAAKNGGVALVNGLLGDVTAVLLAKDPASEAVKTRLCGGGVFTAGAAAGIAEAMLCCTAHRLAAAGHLIVAVTPDGQGASVSQRLGLKGIEVMDQGPGDLGARLERAWSHVGGGGPVAFFGGDCPDIPDEALARIPALLECADVAIGPTTDGGYWTLAARVPQRAVLAGIDWGSDHVYDQTLQRARNAGLEVGSLPLWHDVDRPEDVSALRLRLRSRSAGSSDAGGRLTRLAERLDRLCPPLSPRRDATP